jgi:Dolichyl-phosphate-mannose-protein mannosyltransferase
VSSLFSAVSSSLGVSIPASLRGLVSNGLLVLGSYWIARCLFRQQGGISVFLSAALLFWASTTIGIELLSPFGGISAGPILGWGVCWLMIGGICRWRHRGSDLGRIERALEKGFSPESVVGLALFLAAGLIIGMRSLLLAVKVVSDGPIYHLYFAVRWWQAGRLVLVAAPFGENAATYFPANGDLWFTWLLASWGGDRLARVGQAPFLVLAAIAAYGCARSLGASRSASLIATCWFAASTPLLLYSFEPNVDTIFVAGYMMAAYFFLRALRDQRGTAELCLGALAAGEALGTKAVGVVFIPPLLAIAALVILVRRMPRRTLIVQILALLLLPLVTGGYWYACNARLTGNPLYPLEVRLLGRTIAHGWYGPDAMRLSPYYMPFADWRALGDTLFAVLDPRLVPVWLFALAGASAIKNPSSKGKRGTVAIFSLLAILNVVLYWVFIPYRSQQRFMLQALGSTVVPLALLLDRARWICVMAAILLGMHLLTPEGWPFTGPDGSIPWDLSPLVPNAIGSLIPLFPRIERIMSPDWTVDPLIPAGLLVVILAASVWVAWAWCRISARWSGIGGQLMIALAATAFFVGLGVRDVWSEPTNTRFVDYPRFGDFYAGWQRLETASGPSGSRVAYAGTNIPYYLFGRSLRNQVRYINIDGHRDWLLHDYHREALSQGRGTWPNPRPGWDRSDPDYTAWVRNVDAAGIELLVVTRVNPGEGSHNVADQELFPIERAWADSHPDRFVPLYGRTENDPWFRLYRVLAPAREQRRTESLGKSSKDLQHFVRIPAQHGTNNR